MPDTLIEGIDVSSNQGEIGVRWPVREKVFGFARATIGGHQCDPQFAANWQRMSDAGIFRGAYHFFWPLTPWQDQADNFIKTVGALSPRDLPPVLDLEEAIPKSSASKRDAWNDVPADQRLSIILNWLDAVEQALSMRPIIYTRQNFIDPLLGGEVKTLATSGLWIAHYKVAQPSTPSSWTSWTFWLSKLPGAVRRPVAYSKTVRVNRSNGPPSFMTLYFDKPGRTPLASSIIRRQPSRSCSFALGKS